MATALEPDYSYYETLTETELRAEAAGWVDACYGPGEPGYCNPDKASWRFVADYDVAKLHPVAEGNLQEWFKDEQAMAAMGGRPGVYDSMLTRPINEAIIVLERDGTGYIWDGWHRTGATVTKGGKTIPAIVGTPRSK